ncbi:hypothetical protein E4U44_001724 [Claviceps purpurea]|nr:hypothetical protein E4U44_001724 [Claviceps purpurea]
MQPHDRNFQTLDANVSKDNIKVQIYDRLVTDFEGSKVQFLYLNFDIIFADICVQSLEIVVMGLHTVAKVVPATAMPLPSVEKTPNFKDGKTTCPSNTCCSQYGFFGTTKDINSDTRHHCRYSGHTVS